MALHVFRFLQYLLFQLHLVTFHKCCIYYVLPHILYHYSRTVSAAETKEQATATAAVGGDIELKEIGENGVTLVEEQTPASNYGACYILWCELIEPGLEYTVISL